MADLPLGNPLSGAPWTPFLGVNPNPNSVGTVTISSSLIEGPSGSKTIGPFVIGLTEIGTDEVLDLAFSAAGAQTVVAPVNATLMVIRPPQANTVGLVLGTGVPISPSLPSSISFPTTAGGATYTITAAGAITGSVEVTFA